MISASLNDIFQKSILFAKQLHHEYLTIEHIFYLLLNSSEGANIIQACGGDVEKMKEELAEYLKNSMEILPENIQQDPYESVALARLIDRMVQHVQSSGQTNADIGDLLAALFEEDHTFSYALLNKYQISKLDILEIISHENTQTQADEKNSNLSKYAIDLVAKAQENKIDPVIGREKRYKE